jgi:tryptophan synthase alpha chain
VIVPGYTFFASCAAIVAAKAIPVIVEVDETLTIDVDDIERKIGEIRMLTSLPIGVGFGVKNAETAAAVSRLGDGVVVGSALVGKIEAAGEDTAQALNEITELLRSMRAAIDA